MPEPDENAPSQEQEPAKKKTGDAEVEPAGEVVVPCREEVPDVEPRQIHRRRPLPPVPEKQE